MCMSSQHSRRTSDFNGYFRGFQFLFRAFAVHGLETYLGFALQKWNLHHIYWTNSSIDFHQGWDLGRPPGRRGCNPTRLHRWRQQGGFTLRGEHKALGGTDFVVPTSQAVVPGADLWPFERADWYGTIFRTRWWRRAERKECAMAPDVAMNPSFQSPFKLRHQSPAKVEVDHVPNAPGYYFWRDGDGRFCTLGRG